MERLFVLVLVLILVLGLPGCATFGNEADPGDAQAVYNATVQSYDPHAGQWTTRGPRIKPNGPFGHIYLLRGFHRDRRAGDGALVQLFFRLKIEGWWYVHAAYSEGWPLSVSPLDRRVSVCGYFGCILHEDVAVSLPLAELAAIARRGPFTGKLVGRRGSTTFSVPQGYLEGFLAKLRDRVPGAADFGDDFKHPVEAEVEVGEP